MNGNKSRKLRALAKELISNSSLYNLKALTKKLKNKYKQELKDYGNQR